MYVMQSLPHEAQGLASGIMNTLIRLASTLSMGIATAVYSTFETSSKNETDPMLKFTRTFQVSVAMAALSVVFVPFIRIGTQGHHQEDTDGLVEMEDAPGEKKQQQQQGAENSERHDRLGAIDEKAWKPESGEVV